MSPLIPAPAALPASPILVDPALAQGWSDSPSVVYRLARAWFRHAPKGSAWLPRHVGRLIGPMHETIRTASGARLALSSQDLDYFIMIDVLGGIHDAHIVKLCVESLREGDVFYDIGANAGMVTIEVQSAFKDRVQTFSFEPQPGLAVNCALSAQMNGFKHVQVWPIMLAREAGEGHLYDVQGRATGTVRTVEVVPGLAGYDVQFAHLGRGVYFLRARGNREGVTTTKLVFAR